MERPHKRLVHTTAHLNDAHQRVPQLKLIPEWSALQVRGLRTFSKTVLPHLSISEHPSLCSFVASQPRRGSDAAKWQNYMKHANDMFLLQGSAVSRFQYRINNC